ncbi:hypothetical protein KCM76_09760 [Zooshikella marina]|uniref:hypothetical protein n=1 Tax=Zooshikella ganghwensis TaxID=202772 RepID=UPI001BB02ACE|nr:hypothetical protein [Zooshikella ganghwensis]MBU2706273.1 hypothetical protein [Zooshikella ganghwensis]
MGKKIGLLIGIVIAVIVGAKLYVEYTVKKNVDKFISVLSPYVQVHYKDVSTTVDGEIAINDIKLYPYEEKQTYTIEKALLKLPSIWDFLNLDLANSKKIPESLTLALQGISLPLNEELIEEFFPSQADVTDEVLNIDNKALRKMGYNIMTMDVSASYNYEQINQALKFNAKVSTRNFFSFEFATKLANLPNLTPQQFMFIEPELQSVRFTYRDDSFNKRWLKYCQDTHNLKENECIEHVVASFDYYFDEFQLKLSEPFNKRFTDFMKNSGVLNFDIDIDDGADLRSLDFMQGLEILVFKDVLVSVNNEYIQPLFVRSSSTSTSSNKADGEDGKSTSRPSILSTSEIEAEGYEIEKEIKKRLDNVEDVKNYIGRNAYLKLTNNKKVAGTIIDVRNNRVILKTYTGSQSATLQYQFKKIKYIDVVTQDYRAY